MGQDTLVTSHGHFFGHDYFFTEVVSQNKYSETRLTATSVIRSPRYYGHFFWPPGKNRHTFYCKKTLVNTATPLTWPIFLWPIGDRINGAPILYSRSSPCLLVMDIVASYKHLAITSVWRNISAS